LRFDCIHCRKATTKPQSVKGAFVRMLTFIVLSEKDKIKWTELNNVSVIYNPLSS